jgi:hypothetical protein
MLAELKVFADVLAKVIPGALKQLKAHQRREVLLELQESFFILQGLQDSGTKLLELAGPDPILKLSEIPRERLDEHYERCDMQLRQQGFRLHRLGDIFLKKPFLDFIDPTLRAELDRAIGSKGEGLYSLGAGLFFHFLFGKARKQNESDDAYAQRMREEQGDFIAKLFGDSDKVDVAKHRAILDDLKALQRRLGDTINEVCTNDERIELASKAEALAKKYCDLPELPIRREPT